MDESTSSPNPPDSNTLHAGARTSRNGRAVVLDVSSKLALDAGLAPAGGVVYEKDVVEVLRELGYNDVEVVELMDNPRQALAEIRRRTKSTDVFVNLYDRADACGQKIVDYMEEHGIPFTGAGSRFYDPTRPMLKRVCQGCGIRTAPFEVVTCSEECDEDLARRLGGFPLFVKPEHGYDSVGIDAHSKVSDFSSLCERVDLVANEHGGALLEPYIQGREFSVLVLGAIRPCDQPTAFLPLEYVFPAGRQDTPFITFDDKWGPAFENRWRPLSESDEPELYKELQEMSKSLFVSFEGVGYARMDLRQSSDTGKLYVLDINPNCSLFYKAEGTADTILRFAGWPKTRFLQVLIDQAKYRSQEYHRRNAVATRYTESIGGVGGGVFAVRDLSVGELCYAMEEAPHRLVSKTYVERTWTAAAREDFARYAWPIGEDTYAIWDQNPMNWRPINHSCDPNAWLQGLDVVARRPIAKGEEVTLDYATFLVDHPAFECWCGSASCRREKCLRKGELYELWFQEIYRGHCSPYVEACMRRGIGTSSSV